MTGIVKVDTIQKNDGTAPTAKQLGLNVTGNVLQVVSATLKSSVSTSSTSAVDTGLQASITPAFSTSKVLITITTLVSMSNFIKRTHFIINGGNAASYIGDAGVGGHRSGMSITPRVDAGGYIMHPVSLSYLDSPSTTSSITYKLQWWVEAESAYLNRPYVQDSNGANTVSTITLTEIAG
jgi:hypothetical protein